MEQDEDKDLGLITVCVWISVCVVSKMQCLLSLCVYMCGCLHRCCVLRLSCQENKQINNKSVLKGGGGIGVWWGVRLALRAGAGPIPPFSPPPT